MLITHWLPQPNTSTLHHRRRQHPIRNTLIHKVPSNRNSQVAPPHISAQIKARSNLCLKSIGSIPHGFLVQEPSITMLLLRRQRRRSLIRSNGTARESAGTDAADVPVQVGQAWGTEDWRAIGAGDVGVDEEEGVSCALAGIATGGEEGGGWVEGFCSRRRLGNGG